MKTKNKPKIFFTSDMPLCEPSWWCCKPGDDFAQWGMGETPYIAWAVWRCLRGVAWEDQVKIMRAAMGARR